MTSSFSDELISAYLDGELSDQEREVVEQQLRENAPLQRMCDELRALRGTLKAIPSNDPPDDLAERVLRQAERRMLLGSDADVEPESSAELQGTELEQTASTPAPASTLPMWRNWRFIVACTASAATLLLAVLLLGPGSPYQNVAQRAAPESDAGATDSAMSSTAEPAPLSFYAESESEMDMDGVEESVAALDLSNKRGTNASASRLEMRIDDMTRPQQQQQGEALERSVPEAPPSRGKSAPSSAAPRPDLGAASSERGSGTDESMGMGAGSGGPIIPPPKSAGPPASKAAVADTSPSNAASPREMGNEPEDEQLGETDQKALAQQLLKQLDSNESLLVQVRLPQSLDIYPRDLVAGQSSRDQLEALAGVLFQREGASRTSLQRAKSQEQETELQEKRKSPGEVFVVEGQPGDVRQWLVQLVERADVRFEPVSDALLATQPAEGDDESGATGRRESRMKRSAGGYGYGGQTDGSSGMDGYGGYPGMGGRAGGLGNSKLPSSAYGGMNAEPALQEKANSVADKKAPAKPEKTDQNTAVKGLEDDQPNALEKGSKGDAADNTDRRRMRGNDAGDAAIRPTAPSAPADPAAGVPSPARRFAMEKKEDRPDGPTAAIRIVLTDRNDEERRQAIPALAQGQTQPSGNAQPSNSRIVHLLFRYRSAPAAPADAAEAAKE